MRVALLVVVAACGSTAKHSSAPPPQARDEMARVIGNADALSKLMQGSLVNGGLWFDDEACAKEFPPGEIQADRFLGFAACLAKIPFRTSSRQDALADVAVLTYEPGFEIEARVVSTERGPKLTWIGYASRVDGDATPTISGEGLEAHRLAGGRNGPLPATDARALETENADTEAVFQAQLAKVPAAHRDEVRERRKFPPSSWAWIRVCLDAEGAITSVTPFEATSEVAWSVFPAAVQGWKFRPFVARDHAIAVCAMVRPSLPTDSKLPERLPLPPPQTRSKHPAVVLESGGAGMRRLEAARVAGNKFIWPKDLVKLQIQRAGVTRIESTYRICVDESGAVESVLPLKITGFGDYDRDVVDGLHAWRFAPFKVLEQTVPVCTVISFVYAQTHGPTVVQRF